MEALALFLRDVKTEDNLELGVESLILNFALLVDSLVRDGPDFVDLVKPGVVNLKDLNGIN